MTTLKAVLSQFVQLKDMHVINVDGKFNTEKHRLRHTAKDEIWGGGVEEVMVISE